MTITVTEVNDAPIAVDDSGHAWPRTAAPRPGRRARQRLTGAGQRGEPDADGHRGRPRAPTARSSSTRGTVTYTPAADFNGSDSFTYTVTDNGTTNGANASATRRP